RRVAPWPRAAATSRRRGPRSAHSSETAQVSGTRRVGVAWGNRGGGVGVLCVVRTPVPAESWKHGFGPFPCHPRPPWSTTMTINDTLLAELVSTDPFAELRAKFDGELLTSGHPGYDRARRTVSLRSNRFPLVIVRAASEGDVVAAVAFARRHELPLAVRSGGHSIAQYSVVDDALVTDLSQMKRVEVDPVTRTARVQAGGTSSVGIGGLTTGGGVGYL